MTTMQATTVSDGADVTDDEAVAQLCEKFDFGLLDWSITSNNVFSIQGYDSFEVYHTYEDGLPDYDGGIVTEEFLWELSEYIVRADQLDIRCVAHTKLRFVTASRYVVSRDEVQHTGLDHHLEPVAAPIDS